MENELWAITSYFNPLKHSRRLSNYKVFRDRLRVPLLTIELSFGSPELTAADAEVYINVSGGAMLWQKERLLNLAMRCLPKEAEFVAWLDCDIVFSRKDWHEVARQSLMTRKIVQLFSSMTEFDPSIESAVRNPSREQTGYGIASLMERGLATAEDFEPESTSRMRRSLFGLAWAAERRLIERHSFYDAMIVGSGDRALVCAALGKAESAIRAARMNEVRARHYLAWSERFHADVNGSVGCVDGEIFHCWHGNIADRRYLERHIDFSTQNFDPSRDIRINRDGLWVWTKRGERHADFMRRYFVSRREDLSAPPRDSEENT